MIKTDLPKLVTFDGEARSGKGTIAGAAKDYLRDVLGYKVMLIDAGQVFRVLVVAANRAGVDVNSVDALDTFLEDDAEAEKCLKLVKEVYHMDKQTRDALLYTHQVNEDCAKFGARPLAQHFKDNLLRKWLRDAHLEGFEVVLLDGRALEEVGSMLENEGLCSFVISLYFICDPITGARRNLRLASVPYDQLTEDQRSEVNEVVEQIIARNRRDMERKVHPIPRPVGVPTLVLPNIDVPTFPAGRAIAIVNTSADMTKEEMSSPISKLIAGIL